MDSLDTAAAAAAYTLAAAFDGHDHEHPAFNSTTPVDEGTAWTLPGQGFGQDGRAPLDNMIFYQHNFGPGIGTGVGTGTRLGLGPEPGLGHAEELLPAVLVPNWALVTCTVILTLTITIGIPLNGATIIIFLKCKKLRHLVNFILLLDCISHFLLLFTAVPVQLIGVWNRLSFHAHRSSSTAINATAEVNRAMTLLQQLTTNFVNLTGVLFIFTIAVLRYRRLCWKKKDRLSIINGLKWSLANGSVAFAFTAIQGWAYYRYMSGQHEALGLGRLQYNAYLAKISLIMILMVTAVFCYIRVSQRIWTKTTSHEQGIDMIKLKKSRTVHLRATIHSCIQIILVLVTILPHLYEETVTVEAARRAYSAGASEVVTATAGMPASAQELTGTSPPALPPSLRFTLVEQDDLNKSLDTGVPKVPTPTSAAGAAGLGAGIGDGLAFGHAQGVLSEEQRRSQLLTRLLALTINYSLLILGTPTAYIASCHRFREQFARILCSHRLHFGLQYLFPISTSQSHYQQHRRRSSGGSRRRSRSSVARRRSSCVMGPGNMNGHANGVAAGVGMFAHAHLRESPNTPREMRRGRGAVSSANGSSRNKTTSEIVSTTTATPSYFDQYSSSTSGNSRRSSSCRGARRSSSNAFANGYANVNAGQAPKIVIEVETPSVIPSPKAKGKKKLSRGASLPAGSAAFDQRRGRGRRNSNTAACESIHVIEDSSFAKVVTMTIPMSGSQYPCPSDTTSTATVNSNSNSNSHSSLDPVSGISNNCSSIYQLL